MLMNNNASLNNKNNSTVKLTETALELLINTLNGGRIEISENGNFVQIVTGDELKSYRAQDLTSWIQNDTMLRKVMSYRNNNIADATKLTSTTSEVAASGNYAETFNKLWILSSNDARSNCERQISKLNNQILNAAIHQAENTITAVKDSVQNTGKDTINMFVGKLIK